MKKLIYIFILFMSFSFKGFAQWEEIYLRQNFIGTNIYFINDSTGFWSGNTRDTVAGIPYPSPLILRTADYGMTWDTVFFIQVGPANADSIFISRSTFFTTPQKGFMVGSDAGKLLTSIDGGLTWQLTNPFQFQNGVHHKINFSDSLHGYVVGDNVFSKSIDGGLTWQWDTSLYGAYDLSFPSPDIGYSSNSRSFDAFATQIPHDFSVLAFTRRDVEFWNDSCGLLSGYNSLGLPNSHYILARTSDYGNTWDLTLYYDASFYNFQMMNDSIGYCGFSKTIDGGRTWFRQERPLSTFPHYQFFHCPSENVCYACGSTQTLAHVARTMNGGGPLLQQVGMEPLGRIEKQSPVFPNPAVNTIRFPELPLHSSVEIYNALGQLELKINHISSNEINIESLEGGLYFYRTFDPKKNTTTSGKFIKN